MLPDAFVVLPALPLSPNGKVDRRSLPAPEHDRDEHAFEPPRTPIEIAMAAVWASVLAVPQVGRHDNFFGIGGHSLLAAELVGKLNRALGIDLTLRQLFETPTVRGLALTALQRLAATADENEAGLRMKIALRGFTRVETMPRNGATFVLEQCRRRSLEGAAGCRAPPANTMPQRREHRSLSALVRAEPTVARRAHQPGAGSIQHLPDLPYLGPAQCRRAAGRLRCPRPRHEVLRTRFVLRNGLPEQVVAPHEPFSLRLLDLRQRDGGSAAPARDAFVRSLADDGFDLATDVMLRAGLVRLGDEESVLVIALHHIAGDGWSLAVLDRELQHFYCAFDRDVPATLAPLPVQYSDYSEWQRGALRGATLEGHLAYWRGHLASLATLELPADRPRPMQPSFRGRQERIEIPAAIAASLKDLARKQNATLYMTLLAAFQVLLMRYSGQDDVAVGSPVAGRGRPEIEGLIGFFVNTLVMRGDLSGNPRFAELLQRTRERAIDAFAHQDLPFEKLVEELNPERDFGRNPLFQVMFTLQGRPRSRRSGCRHSNSRACRTRHSLRNST